VSEAPEVRQAKAKAIAEQFLVGHVTGVEGREDEFARAVVDVLRTITHTKGYPHETNDALVMAWLTGVRYACKAGTLDEFNAEHVDVMAPILDRMRGVIEDSGEREVALETMCGWSTCHYQLVVTETHKAPGKRWFLSPFTTALDAGRRVGQFDFDEDFVVTETFLPRIHGYADRLGVTVTTDWNPETRYITVALAD
jgi:hypothetical protein